MITYTYKHTQQKQRLEKLFQQELLPALLQSKEVKRAEVNFKLIIDQNGRTKEAAIIYLTCNKQMVSFRAFKGRFKKSANIIIEEVKNYLSKTDHFLSA
ncbi:hypothetical protein FNJ87_14970 [Nonlabens mediterrranea]|uniref:Uncharacterized protein n=1 Tax=Nonlabens mediterrranea TaxID=1419947 RepID=A0ABS0A8G9_9FLAO|nr:hypothetical protein [Nonlabens mediterrranea]